MKRLILASALAALAAGPALAHGYVAGDLRIGHPWSRPAAKGMTGVGYLSITNTGKRPETLIGATTAQARKVELHRSQMQGSVSMMSFMGKGVTIAPGQTLTLEPGGYHFMFMGLARGEDLGGRLPATLVFAKAGKVPVEFAVQAGPADGMTHAH